MTNDLSIEEQESVIGSCRVCGGPTGYGLAYLHPICNDLLAREQHGIFDRDGYKCQECGAGADSYLTIDHIQPRSKGGGDEPENLQTLCRSCNSRKGAT